MFFDGRSRGLARSSAIELELEDLIAQKPRRGLAPRGRGGRGPLGERPGRGRAQSLDFDGTAPYTPGDDVRHIDWRTTARSGSTQVRKFAAHSHRSRMIIADLNPDLYFGTQTRLMAKTVALVAARLAWESQSWGEPVGLMVPGQFRLRPRAGRRHLIQALDRLCSAYQTPSDAGPTLPEALVMMATDLQRGDELCVVSDFGADTQALTTASRPLSETYRLYAYLVEDAIARTPPSRGQYPSSLMGDSERRSFTTSGSDPRRELDLLRQEKRDSFLDHQWAFIEAADLLPLQCEAAS